MFEGGSLLAKLTSIRLQGGVRPSLQCQLDVQVPRRIGNLEIGQVYLTGIAGKLVAYAKNQELLVGSFVQDRVDQLPAERTWQMPLRVWLDWATIDRLERLRTEGDGHLHFRVEQGTISAAGWALPRAGVAAGPATVQLNGFGETRYVRDDWLEDLKSIGYREMRVYEGPPTHLPKEWNVTDYFDKAWMVLHQGHADDAMQECRKALEGVREALVAKGLARKEDKEIKIDFQRLTSSETLGETLSKVWSGVWGFQTPGQHHGKAIRYSDGEFAFFSALALVRYVARCVEALE